MANIFLKLFDKKEVIDTEKLVLSEQLSIQHAVADTYLLSLAAKKNSLDIIQPYLQLTNEVELAQNISISKEIENLDKLIKAYKLLIEESFFINLQNNIPKDLNFQIKPFLLFPLVQNAIRFGYNALEKHPLRIKMNYSGSEVKFEVSNRVNHYMTNQKKTDLISNFEARLALHYGDNAQLLFNSNTMVFKATLILK